MNEREGFLKAIASQTGREAIQTRRVYADWLEENGHEDEAQEQRAWTARRQASEDWMRAAAQDAGVTYEHLLSIGHDMATRDDLLLPGSALAGQDDSYWAAWSALTSSEAPPMPSVYREAEVDDGCRGCYH